MVQKEVADRLRARPGDRRYGGISAALGRVRKIELVRQVDRACFTPPPRVDSSVILLRPLAAPLGEVADQKGYLALVRQAFQGRRKTLLNALTPLADRAACARWIEASGLDPTIRPERLGPTEFSALQRAREAELDNA